MREAYPILINEEEDVFLIYVPDMDIYTQSEKNVADAIEMAIDAIGLKGILMEDDGMKVPEPSTYTDAMKIAKEKADDILDFTNGMITMAVVDFAEYRRKVDNKAVKKNCTIPYWVSKEADKAGINYSQILTKAIVNILGLEYNY